MDDLPVWMRYLEALGPVAITIAGLCIAASQYRLAKAKYSYALYERRRSLLYAARKVMDEYQRSALDHNHLADFDAATIDAPYLLSEAMVKQLDDLRTAAINIVSLRRINPPPRGYLEAEEFLSRLIVRNEFQERFRPMFGDLIRHWG